MQAHYRLRQKLLFRTIPKNISPPYTGSTIRYSSNTGSSKIHPTEYGLSAGIIAHDLARAQRIGDQLNSGMLHINDQTVNDECVNPFGGCGCSGNGGNIGGPANWENFSQLRWITVQGDAHAYPF